MPVASNKKKKPATRRKKVDSNVPEELKGLAEVIAGVDAGDKEAIVKIGIRLEQAWTTLRIAGAEKSVLDLLKHSLTALQRLYQDQVQDATAAWNVVCLAVQAVEDHLEGKADAADEMAFTSETLQQILGNQTADKPAEKPSPDEAPAPADEADSKCLGAIEDIEARLLSVGPDDHDELAALRDAIVAVSAMDTVAAGAMGHLIVAAQQIQTVVAGQASDAGAMLGEIAKALGQAATVQENYQAGGPAELAPPVEKNLAAQGENAPKIQFEGPAVMMEDCDVELVGEYIVECLDHITNAEGALLELESNSDDADQINVVFRAFHTIKGTSGFLNFDRIQKCAHLAENLLDRAREGEIKIMGGYADLCLRSCDALRAMIEGLNGIASGGELPIPDDLMELLEILSDPEAAGYGEQGVDDTMRVGDILVGKGQVSRRTIEKVENAKGDKKIGEALVEKGVASPAEVVEAIRTQKQQKQGKTTLAENSIRVGTGRLDSLINMVGELVIAQSMVAGDPEVSSGEQPRLHRSVTHSGKIIRELQDLTMALRMVPLKGIFQKMNRLVRDLGKKSGKQVQFITDGEETEIDRNMVESLNDPLVHMIRNSLDHGLELPEDRAAAGKDPTGTVRLCAYQTAGNVVIELHDDGKGLNREKILSKAIEKGVVEQGRDMSDNEIFMLIFAAGFSTADVVTDVSGRGVGMDVVRRNIEALRGRIEIASQPGKGSTFTIRLPLTMAITDAMILRVGEERYLLPTISIQQSFQPDEDSISSVTGQGEMVMLRGELLPLFRLHNLFGVTNAGTKPYEGLLVVIEGDGRRCALMVDELLGQQQVVIKSLGDGMTKVQGVSGGAILGDGKVGLILDSAGLLQLAEGRAEALEAEGVMV
ncbi:MAG: chemotaxis protein CheA [Phycisphaerae bacterium]|nr:chemotaxis protein CheA [Phycisphaerae bacterium]